MKSLLAKMTIFFLVLSLLAGYYYSISFFSVPNISPKRTIGDLRDIVLLSSIINSEANTKDYRDMYLVGSTVLNRVDSDMFPSTIEEVICQDGQFKGYYSDQYFRSPKSDHIALNLMLGNGRDYSVMYFYNDAKSTDRVFVEMAKSKFCLVDSTSSHLFYSL
jgi:spore germination cell wall hydrolase CwlJ-like protein